MVRILRTASELAEEAAQYAAHALRESLSQKETVRLLAATGQSQAEFLCRLIGAPNIDWPRVELFHLDEYIGIGSDHRASFARYIRQRIIEPAGIERYHLLDGLGDPQQVTEEMGRLINSAPVDLAFAGIGENGHLAFNDPPADFDTDIPYLVVALDHACRLQQVGEGWFASLDQVPRQAISISVHQLLKARQIICVVPDERKAKAVRMCLEGPLSPDAPASVLRAHPNTAIFLDKDSASLLRSG